MLKRFIALIIPILTLVFVPAAFGQKATEMYIPIGQSPGVSGKTCLMGTIQAVDAKKRTLVVSTQKGAQIVKLPNRIPIWIDRSQEKKSNQYGKLADLQPGRTVEVRLGDGNAGTFAQWIKVRL
jgi:hypothetical protein